MIKIITISRGLDGLSNADKIWIAQKKVIEEPAEKAVALIVDAVGGAVENE